MNEIRSTQQIVQDAVTNRYLLHINYHDFSRVVQPRKLYADDSGRFVLVATQLSGGCDAGETLGLKHFWLDDVKSARAVTEAF